MNKWFNNIMQCLVAMLGQPQILAVTCRSLSLLKSRMINEIAAEFLQLHYNQCEISTES